MPEWVLGNRRDASASRRDMSKNRLRMAEKGSWKDTNLGQIKELDVSTEYRGWSSRSCRCSPSGLQPAAATGKWQAFQMVDSIDCRGHLPEQHCSCQ